MHKMKEKATKYYRDSSFAEKPVTAHRPTQGPIYRMSEQIGVNLNEAREVEVGSKVEKEIMQQVI